DLDKQRAGQFDHRRRNRAGSPSCRGIQLLVVRRSEHRRGTVNASSTVTIGYGVNSTGSVSVTSGQLIATNDITYVGKSGFGQMTISGGNASFAFLSVGNNANGQLSVTGGQLMLKPRTTND